MAASPSVNWKGVSAVVGLLVTLGGVAIGFTSSHAVIGQKVSAQEKRVDALEDHSQTNGLAIATLTEQVANVDKKVASVQQNQDAQSVKQDRQSELLNQIIGKLDQLNGRSP